MASLKDQLQEANENLKLQEVLGARPEDRCDTYYVIRIYLSAHSHSSI